jgi:hypothetical protein
MSAKMFFAECKTTIFSWVLICFISLLAICGKLIPVADNSIEFLTCRVQ